jgi:hypothetical protein
MIDPIFFAVRHETVKDTSSSQTDDRMTAKMAAARHRVIRT